LQEDKLQVLNDKKNDVLRNTRPT